MFEEEHLPHEQHSLCILRDENQRAESLSIR
jgi:hypothetical protein